jgi:hypothetical protein
MIRIRKSENARFELAYVHSSAQNRWSITFYGRMEDENNDKTSHYF